MKKNLTEKQLTKGLRQLEGAKESLLDDYKQYINYKKSTKGWSSCCMSNHVEDTLKELKENISHDKEWIASLERKYL